MTNDDAPDWRPVIAALANDDVRTIAAHLMLREDTTAALDALAPSRRRHVRSTLTASGLAQEGTHGLEFRADVFRSLLAARATTRPSGIDRFVRDGRLQRYPASARNRTAVLRWLRDTVIGAGETLTEKDITLRLAERVDDSASFRRYLVDAELITRSLDGSAYRRAGPTEER